MTDVLIRPGRAGDEKVLLDLFDGAVRWLVAQGREGQWGSEPFTGNPRREERMRGFVAGGGLVIAEVGGVPAGALALTATPPAHIPAVDEPEVYIDLLITSRELAGHGVGARLIDYAVERTRERGVDLLRVDCYAGGDGKLVRYYEGQGFRPTERFDVNGWIGQVFERRVLSAVP
ncbi:GNAT family N-acetyltransferase [Amycolatopsis suaedae]|uniref:GNAT family N-acetyltransferase n=1 Tax=Amycolatopsis suaedae TaxID=2510978 RepID=A0A4Q7J0A2_9PSEU|nr:GNAT family N-acetyltransferase [Amycolatopsis suaedae]RZQ60761.1 GNAT family N-acetyltransferase [Amycolatopsis suaedae]